MATSDRAYIMLGLRIVGVFGATIAVPAVLAAIVGQALDARWGTRPWALTLCLLIAFAGTALALIRMAKAYGREYQSLINKNQKP